MCRRSGNKLSLVWSSPWPLASTSSAIEPHNKKLSNFISSLCAFPTHLLHLKEGMLMFSLSTTARKTLAITSIAALSLGAAACNRGESSDGEGGGSVTLALSTQTNPFFVELRDGAQAKADELGIELDVQDASDDAATQADQLRNAETSGADVVIVNPTDSDAVGSAVESLNNADIPVIA